jgi:hypothetical protein
MHALQALHIALCLSHGHVFLNFDTTEQTEIWISELQLVSFHVGLQSYGSLMNGAVCLRPGEITGYRKGG